MGFNVDDLKDSKFLTQNDVDPPVLVTIVSAKQYDMSLDREEPRMRWTLSFKELPKPFTLNITNGQVIAAMVGSGKSDDWIGHKIVLYRDPSVMYSGKMVGGIRCRPPKNQPEQKGEANPDWVGDEAKPPPTDSEIPF